MLPFPPADELRRRVPRLLGGPGAVRVRDRADGAGRPRPGAVGRAPPGRVGADRHRDRQRHHPDGRRGAAAVDPDPGAARARHGAQRAGDRARRRRHPCRRGRARGAVAAHRVPGLGHLRLRARQRPLHRCRAGPGAPRRPHDRPGPTGPLRAPRPHGDRARRPWPSAPSWAAAWASAPSPSPSRSAPTSTGSSSACASPTPTTHLPPGHEPLRAPGDGGRAPPWRAPGRPSGGPAGGAGGRGSAGAPRPRRGGSAVP